MSRAKAAMAQSPANLPNAKRQHSRLRVVREQRPDANYEIVHGVVLLQNPDTAKGFTTYFPGEVLRLSWDDAERMITTGVIVPVGSEPVLKTTVPDRARSYYDQANKGKEPEGTAKLVVLDVESAALEMYDADSAKPNMGGLNGSGR